MSEEKLSPAVLNLTLPFYPIHSRYDRRTLYSMESTARMEDYVRALRREIESAASDYDDCEILAVKVSGGIAGHAADETLGHLLRDLRGCFHFSEDAQTVLNVHPGMVSAETLLACRRGRVDWLSVDYATADPGESEAIGRFLPPNAMNTTMLVLSGSPLKLSFDVLIGLPGQSKGSLRRTLDTALGYGARHIRLYLFELVSGTDFAEKDAPRLRESSSPRSHLPSVEERAELYRFAADCLCQNGFYGSVASCFTLDGELFPWDEATASGCARIGFGLDARTRMDGLEAENTRDMNVYLRHAGNPQKITAIVKEAKIATT